MKRAHSPVMEESELPVSPRKKLKLEDSSSDAKGAVIIPEVPSSPHSVPHNHLATTTYQLSKPASMGFIDVPTSSQTPPPTASISSSPIAMPDTLMEEARRHTEASAAMYRIMAENASKASSRTTDVADALGGISKEAACGITEFVSPELLGFSGILKKRYAFWILVIHTLAKVHRYTDFLVNEILPSGEVVHLDNLKASPKSHKHTELLKTAGKAASMIPTNQKAEALQLTSEQNVQDHEQPRTAPRPASNNDSQAISHTDTSDQEPSTFKLGENVSPIEPSQPIPQSMQGFNKYEPAPASVDSQNNISPHKRVPLPAPSVPLSMQDLDGKQSGSIQEKPTRRKEKVHIRQTSQGWVEFDKEKEDEIRKRKAEEDAAAGVKPDDASQPENIEPEESKEMLQPKELDQEQVLTASTQASWQAFAGNAPSSSFQVSSQSTKLDLNLP